ncbi:MAG: hypothetical protein IPJ81_09005 [Chitinophagaceae bacterium]|nr:hypothetical protein [Chitinophagaceae bacterium]
MAEEKLIEAIVTLTDSINNLTESVEKLHTIETDKFNTDNSFDMMQTLNGSLQELIKELEQRPLK